MPSISSGRGFLLVEPGRSRALASALAAVHGLAVVAAAAAPLGLAARLLLVALIALGFAEAMGVHVLRRGRWAVASARCVGEGLWVLVMGDGSTCEAGLAPRCLVVPGLVVLRFALGRWRRRTLIVPADALAPDVNRRLRALLLGCPAPERPGAQGERGE